MGMEFILINQDISMKVNGRITCQMALDKLLTPIKLVMWENFLTTKSMEGELYSKKMICTEVLSSSINLMEKYSTRVKMDKNTLEIGNKIKSMVMAYTNGKTEVFMRVITVRVIGMVRVE